MLASVRALLPLQAVSRRDREHNFLIMYVYHWDLDACVLLALQAVSRRDRGHNFLIMYVYHWDLDACILERL